MGATQGLERIASRLCSGGACPMRGCEHPLLVGPKKGSRKAIPRAMRVGHHPSTSIMHKEGGGGRAGMEACPAAPRSVRGAFGPRRTATRRTQRGAGRTLRTLRSGGAPHHPASSDAQVDGAPQGRGHRRSADGRSLPTVPQAASRALSERRIGHPSRLDSCPPRR